MAAADPELLGETEAQQLEMLGLPETARLTELQVRRTGKAGRPLGSHNKRDVKRAEFLLAQHGDPRAVLLRIANMRVDVLAAALGCSALEALQEIRIASQVVLPFVAQKLPLAIDLTTRKIYRFEVVDPTPPDQAGGAEESITAPFVRLLQQQGGGEPNPEPQS